ncbi:MAG: DUF1292 domain-containing protein [Ruminococcaceae bacterium]|nr:DUF1292 domain-containing protein [Oscillospiraceae bacterium]
MSRDHILVMTDENGKKIEFEFLDQIEYKGNQYVVLLPVGEEDDLVLILQIESEDAKKTSYIAVEDEAVADAVYHLFRERAKDTFEFLD